MGGSIIIHGGIRGFENIDSNARRIQQALHRIAADAYAVLNQRGARAAAVAAVTALEDCELFNAGTGSRIQSDGEIRMSAALMDGVQNVFSGVINIQYVKNPIQVAALLAAEKHAVLAGDPATRYARGRGFPSHSPYTEHRVREHQAGLGGSTGTVGAAVVDDDGAVFAATSTGGVGGEIPGRVSDSATVAGNYATPGAAVSCTGDGEQIVRLCVASRIAVRTLDGRGLQDAVRATIEEGRARGYVFGLIAMAADGTAVVEETSGQTLFAIADKTGIRTFGPGE